MAGEKCAKSRMADSSVLASAEMALDAETAAFVYIYAKISQIAERHTSFYVTLPAISIHLTCGLLTSTPLTHRQAFVEMNGNVFRARIPGLIFQATESTFEVICALTKG